MIQQNTGVFECFVRDLLVSLSVFVYVYAACVRVCV